MYIFLIYFVLFILFVKMHITYSFNTTYSILHVAVFYMYYKCKTNDFNFTLHTIHLCLTNFSNKTKYIHIPSICDNVKYCLWWHCITLRVPNPTFLHSNNQKKNQQQKNPARSLQILFRCLVIDNDAWCNHEWLRWMSTFNKHSKQIHKNL